MLEEGEGDFPYSWNLKIEKKMVSGVVNATAYILQESGLY